MTPAQQRRATRAAYLCPVCGTRGLPVHDVPGSEAHAKDLFDVHLDRHTHAELTAFVRKLMCDARGAR
jgi:hypothetical protein